jgi:hypothetical protein
VPILPTPSTVGGWRSPPNLRRYPNAVTSRLDPGRDSRAPTSLPRTWSGGFFLFADGVLMACWWLAEDSRAAEVAYRSAFHSIRAAAADTQSRKRPCVRWHRVG